MKTEIAVFGGGCFWCTQAIFSRLKGIKSVTSGYAGGTMENPSYYDVSTGETGYAEVIKIEFDPKTISYENLLEVFWEIHNPTTLNRQGADIGSQYRSIIFYTTENQKRLAEKSKQQKTNKGFKVVTEVKPLINFYSAEAYHQKYYENNPDVPYCQLVINPKLTSFQKKFSFLLK